MDDLIKRLREPDGDNDYRDLNNAMQEAADEIERLREALGEMLVSEQRRYDPNRPAAQAIFKKNHAKALALVDMSPEREKDNQDDS